MAGQGGEETLTPGPWHGTERQKHARRSEFRRQRRTWAMLYCGMRRRASAGRKAGARRPTGSHPVTERMARQVTPVASLSVTPGSRTRLHTVQVVDEHRPPSSPYVGQQSLYANSGRETWDLDFFVGVRPWEGAEFWINPEIDRGFGLSGTFGVAGFPSAEAYKVGSSYPYARLPRMFLRQTIDLGGDTEKVEAGANQFAGSQTTDRLESLTARNMVRISQVL